MKVIALLPVRNEAWILRHSLACLSAFADVILVSDQGSDDGSVDLYRQFPKVAVLPPADATTTGRDRLPVRVRWRLLDAARSYEGCNLLWSTDADELIAPALVTRWLDAHCERLEAGTAIETHYYNLWGTPAAYRNDGSPYRPQRKVLALVDDRTSDYIRDPQVKPLHEPRVPQDDRPAVLAAEGLPVLHLQWLRAEQNQIKQAWYRAVELIDGRASPSAINAFYAITLPAGRVATAPVPQQWLAGLTFPDFAANETRSWQQRELYAWFDERGIEFFEPLEIWHIDVLRREFRRRTGRAPRPDRSYRPGWDARARRFVRRAASAVQRRMGR